MILDSQIIPFSDFENNHDGTVTFKGGNYGVALLDILASLNIR